MGHVRRPLHAKTNCDSQLFNCIENELEEFTDERGGRSD